MDDFVANMIYNNIKNSEYNLMYQTIREAGLWNEFIEFSRKYPLCTEEVFKEFGRLHPDKFYVPEKDESYEYYVIVSE